MTNVSIEANSVDPDLDIHCLSKTLVNNFADEKADTFCSDWPFKG